MTKKRFLAFSGSTRSASLNRKLIGFVSQRARTLGAEINLIDLADYSLPLYNGDLEHKDGLPENAMKLKELIAEHDGMLISTPEYNGSFPALLKNTLDWVSRPSDKHDGLSSYQGKIVGLFAASPGRLGGIRSLGHLRTQMSDLGAVVLPGSVAVPQADKQFDESGNVTSSTTVDMIDKLVGRAIRLAAPQAPGGS